MFSKFGVIACLTCGEYIKSTMNESLEQFEMHMCCGANPDEKKKKLLKLREMIDAEINAIVPTPPPMPAALMPRDAQKSSSKTTGTLKDQMNIIKLKKIPKAGKENTMNLRPDVFKLHDQLNQELASVLRKRRQNMSQSEPLGEPFVKRHK